MNRGNNENFKEKTPLKGIF